MKGLESIWPPPYGAFIETNPSTRTTHRRSRGTLFAPSGYIQYLYANFDQVLNDGSDSTAGVERYVQTVSFTDPSILFQQGLYHFSPFLMTHQHGLLAGRIITQPQSSTCDWPSCSCTILSIA
jgi:hypothetical protein